MNQAIIYIHGKGGSAAEAAHYKEIFGEADVIGFDYRAQTPWDAKEEFVAFFDKTMESYDNISVIANSIGAYFTMSALANKPIERVWFISPIVDMEQLIMDMMIWANVTEKKLSEQKEIKTNFGETLSWDYLCYARTHPICWQVPTKIAYGEKDHLTTHETMHRFAEENKCTLSVMDDGEHWFRTEEQMAFLDAWLRDE